MVWQSASRYLARSCSYCSAGMSSVSLRSLSSLPTCASSSIGTHSSMSAMIVSSHACISSGEARVSSSSVFNRGSYSISISSGGLAGRLAKPAPVNVWYNLSDNSSLSQHSIMVPASCIECMSLLLRILYVLLLI